MPSIRLVYADGIVGVAGLPDGITDLEERLGPHLAAVVTSCAPNADDSHTIAVPEIPTAALGAPLRRFITHGKLGSSPATTPPLLLAASYKAAERLDIKGLVRAVERAVMAAVAVGDVRLEEISAAFAGCPRIVSLCDNYLELPGIRTPPPFNITTHLPALVAEHGAVFIICAHPKVQGKGLSLGSINIVTDTRRCIELARNDSFCRQIVELSGDTDGMPITLFSMPDSIENRDEVYPSCSGTWLLGASAERPRWPGTRITCTPQTLAKELKYYFEDTTVTLAVCHEGRKLFSSNQAADTAFTSGMYAAYGEKPPNWW
jgi:hypothetical protein